MLKFTTKLILSIIALLLLSNCHSSYQDKKIGIVVPLENKALDEIVAGFTATIQSLSSYPIKIKVANAQGDINLQRAIIQQMRDENYDVIVPIGTTATQMTLAIVKNQPIVSVAAKVNEEDRKKLTTCNIVAVDDEIPSAKSIQFIHAVYPQFSHLTLIHSATDKVFPEVKETVTAGINIHLEIKPLMITSLNDLYSVSSAIPKNSQGIFILKDILVASGISTLTITASRENLPVIASDQGSVQEGAAFALGVHEYEIGVEGAKLAAQVLDKRPICSLPITEMTKLTVFVNNKALAKNNLKLNPIKYAANKFHYQIEIVGSN